MNDKAFSDATKISDASKDAIVSMDGVYKRFKDFEALKNVNFKVGRQEVVVVIGPSGSGNQLLFAASTDSSNTMPGP